MTLHVVYESAAGSTTDLASTDHFRLPSLDITQHAEEGIAGRSSVPIEDVGGALTIVGLKRVWLWESAESAGNQVIGTFYVTDREIGRTGSASLGDQVLSADRWWSVGLIDHNETMSRRIVTGTDGDRPEETDIARLTWIIGSQYLASVNNSGGYINAVGAVTMDKADLRGQRAYDVIAECANQSNKNFHLIPNSPTTTGGAATYSLWYDFDYSGQYSSALRLTNVRADVDNSTTFAVDPDMVLRRTPERVYSGVLVRYQGGEVYAQNTTTGNTFAFRDAVHHAINVQSASVANVRATRYLDDADAEEDRITCRFVVPKEKVNGLREGQRVQVKFSHLPGYSSDYGYMRCLRRTVRQLSDEFYEIRVELSGSAGGVGALTATQGNLMRPNNGTITGGEDDLEWGANGDEPDAGDEANALPFQGLLEPVGSTDNWTAIRTLGDGLVTIELVVAGVRTTDPNPTITMGCRIVVSGTIVGAASQDFSGGLGNYTFDNTSSPLVVSNVAVRNGDEIRAEFFNTEGVAALVPPGVGSSLHELRVTGSLRA